MKLSSMYIQDRLKEKFCIIARGGISREDGYLRPFLFGREEDIPSGHVCVMEAEEAAGICGDGSVLFVFWGRKGKKEEMPLPFLWVEDREKEEMESKSAGIRLLNCLQRAFERCDEWEKQISQEVLKGSELQKILRISADFMKNPVAVMTMDFTLVAEGGTEDFSARGSLQAGDGINIEYMNTVLQSKEFHCMQETGKAVLFPEHISGYRSLNLQLAPDARQRYRLVLTEWRRSLEEGDYCLLQTLGNCLELMLARSGSVLRTDELHKVFETLLTDRAADYMETSWRLEEHGWSAQHTYLCLVLQITYLNKKNLSTNAICRYIQDQFRHSCSFLHGEEIVTYFDLDRLKMDAEEIGRGLTYFIRDSYLKAGYSRCIKGHMNLRRQYLQAKTALDVGGRKKPYSWIHHFDRVALTYILEQSTRKFPAQMICHEGLLAIRESDEKNQTEYMKTLRTWLEQNLNATQAANVLYIHRSTFLYRMEKIKEILQSNLENADEIFYLNLSFRLLEQEEEKNG